MTERSSAWGNLVIISGASGTGKTSLVRAMLRRDQHLKVSVSCTTRKPRPGEVPGEDYFFISEAEFASMREAGAFLEYADVYGHYYGTPEKALMDWLRAGLDVLLEIDWQGAYQVRQRLPQAISVFVLPPSMACLRRRLQERGHLPPEAMARRIRHAGEEIARACNYDALIVNADLAAAGDELYAFIAARRRGDAAPCGRNTEHLQALLAEAQAAAQPFAEP